MTLLTRTHSNQCRAVAAAVFGDDTRAEPVLLPASERFEFLANRSVDLLLGLITHTMGRDIFEVGAID